VEAAIAAIDEQLDNLTQTIAENQAALFEVDLSGGEDAIEDINRQIEVLNQKISSQLDKATIEQLEDAIVHLKKQIEAVTFTLETLPVASDDMDFGGEEPDISDLQW